MSSIRWGIDTGADLCLPFNGNATLSGCRLIGAGGADDHIALDWNALKEASQRAAQAHRGTLPPPGGA